MEPLGISQARISHPCDGLLARPLVESQVIDRDFTKRLSSLQLPGASTENQERHPRTPRIPRLERLNRTQGRTIRANLHPRADRLREKSKEPLDLIQRRFGLPTSTPTFSATRSTPPRPPTISTTDHSFTQRPSAGIAINYCHQGPQCPTENRSRWDTKRLPFLCYSRPEIGPASEEELNPIHPTTLSGCGSR